MVGSILDLRGWNGKKSEVAGKATVGFTVAMGKMTGSRSAAVRSRRVRCCCRRLIDRTAGATGAARWRATEVAGFRLLWSRQGRRDPTKFVIIF